MLGNFNQTWVNTLPTNIWNDWTTSFGSMGGSEALHYSCIGKHASGSFPHHLSPGEVDPGLFGKGTGFLGLLQAPSVALRIAGFVLIWRHSNQADTHIRHSQVQEMAFLNSILFYNLLFNYLLPLYCLDFLQDSGGGLGERFPLRFNIIIHNDYIWSFYKFLIILSDWCMVICIGYLAEYSICSVTYI